MARKPVITINPLFKLLIWINSTLCVVTLSVMMTIAILEEPGKNQPRRNELFSACQYVFTMTSGAFIGLLGGKSAEPTGVQEAAPVEAQKPPT